MLVLLDGNAIASETELHAALASQLDFGPHYGNNLAALWDRISADVPRPVKIVWTNISASRTRLGDEFVTKVVELFERARRQDADAGLLDRFEYEARET